MNNLKSYTEYAVTSSTTDFVIGFEFNYGTDAVNVTVDGKPASEVGYTVVQLNSTTIRLTPAVTSGTVRLQRETDIDEPDNRFTAGAKFIASNMDENFTQIRQSQQEVRDGFNKLKDDTYALIDGLDEAVGLAQDAAQSAQDAAQVANDVAAQLNDKVDYQELTNAIAATPHNNLQGRDAVDTHPASAISYDAGSTYPAGTVGRALYDINRTNILVTGNAEFGEFSVQSSVKINGVPMKRHFNMRNYIFERPAGFTWNANNHKFWLDEYGVPQSDIDPDAYDIASKNSPTQYFVSLTGNNTGSNPGTDPNTPLRSITRALALVKLNADANAVIWVQAGRYDDGNTWGTTESIASNVSIKVWNMSVTAPYKDTTDSAIVLPTNDTTLVWTLDTGSTYRTTRSGTSAVVDFAISNNYGDASFYEQVDTLAQCNATAGTWCSVGTTLYVHALDNRKPDAQLQVYVAKTLGRAVTGNYSVYIERVWFYGGTYPFSALVDAGSTNQTVFMNKCRFWYGAENGLQIRGVRLTIMYKCSCAYNRDDGFNYHAELGGTTRPTKVIEFKCTAYRNGQNWSPLLLTNQGSTTHDASHIVRIGCNYFDNGRQCVTDVGGSQSWIMACQGYSGSKRFEGSYYSVYQCAAGNMWLDHCDAADHDYSVASTNNGKVHVRRSNIYPSIYTAHNVFTW